MIVQIRPSTNVADHEYVRGYNADLDASSADEDVTPYGNHTWAAAVQAAADIDIVSSDAADDAAGTGARTIVLTGLDSDWLLQSETIALDGTTDVHPANDYIRILSAYVATVGTGGVNAGTITLDVNGSSTQLQIPIGHGRGIQGVYTVPADYSGAYIVAWSASVMNKAGGYVNFVLDARENGGSWQTHQLIGVSSAQSYWEQFLFPDYIPAKTDIRLRAIDASADNLIVAGGFQLMFV